MHTGYCRVKMLQRSFCAVVRMVFLAKPSNPLTFTSTRIQIMLRDGILNPAINEMISRFRHTNLLVIADRGFPYWPDVPTVDISLVDDIPTVLQVFEAVRDRCSIGGITMANEFREHNSDEQLERLQQAGDGTAIHFERHDDLKKRVPGAIGLIRTGDTVQYANMILESA